MKKIVGYVFAASLLTMPMVSIAADLRFGGISTVGTSEVVTNDVYMGGANVTSTGTVNGDVVAGGGSVLISGKVGADILAGGGTVTILADVADDVRVGGGNITVLGKVGGDLVIGGGQVTIGGAGIAGDVVLGGGVVRIDAPVAGSVRGGGGNIYINAPISGDITIEADSVTLGKSAVISGILTYKSPKELVKEDGAVINGQVKFEPRAVRKVPTAAGIAALISFWILAKFLALFVCALVIGLTFKRYSREIVTRASMHPWTEIGRGLVTFIALPIISILLFVTLLGIPFGVLGLLGFAVLLIFTWIVTPIIVGSVAYNYITKESGVSWKTILLGVFICSILGLIPLIGWLAQALLMLLTLGTIVNVKSEMAGQWR